MIRNSWLDIAEGRFSRRTPSQKLAAAERMAKLASCGFCLMLGLCAGFLISAGLHSRYSEISPILSVDTSCSRCFTDGCLEEIFSTIPSEGYAR